MGFGVMVASLSGSMSNGTLFGVTELMLSLRPAMVIVAVRVSALARLLLKAVTVTTASVRLAQRQAPCRQG